MTNLTQRTWELFYQLCPIPSVSTSPGEGQIAQEIQRLLAQLPLFQEQPGNLILEKVPGTAHAQVVAAFVPGQGRETVLLLNHHDVVDTGDYGPFRELAYNPRELTAKLDPQLVPPEAQADLASGEWLFGRGVMDMKFGLAMQLALTEAYTTNHPEQGNILFLSVPDEENNSAGMLHALSILRRFQEQHNLDFVAAVNSEPHTPREEGFSVQTGSDGKLLALVCCYGLETHVGELFAGLNSHLLLAEVTRLLELNPGFADSYAGEHTLPPTLLLAGLLRDGYSVSTPRGAYGFFNISTLQASPAQILTKLTTLAGTAMTNALEKLERARTTWAKQSGETPPSQTWQPKVMTYGQLEASCREYHGQDFTQALAQFIQETKDSAPDDRALALAVLDFVYAWCPDREPKIILAIAPPFYPPVANGGRTPKEKRVLRAVEALSEQTSLTIHRREFHRGISDLSYCCLQNPEAVSKSLTENCPGWGSRYYLPLAAMAKIDAPALNLGPLGKDFHKVGERLHLPSSELVPGLLDLLVKELLKNI